MRKDWTNIFRSNKHKDEFKRAEAWERFAEVAARWAREGPARNPGKGKRQ